MKNEKGVMHAVVVSAPIESHTRSLLQLAELLADRGFFITFANTEWSERHVLEASKHSFLANQRPQFRFLSFPEGLPPEHGRITDFGELLAALQKSGPALENVLRSRAEGEDVPPVTCIVSDCFMSSCTQTVAANMGVARVIYWPFCAATSIAQKNASSLASQGHIPVKVSEGKREENLITTLPGNIPPLWPTDLLHPYRQQASELVYKTFLSESQVQNNSNNVDYVLVNTFEELEGKEAAAALSVNGCPSAAIGPIFLPYFLEGKQSNSNIWEEDKSCLEWLDTQKVASVIYVSFGSLALQSQQHLEELALGLEQSQQPFLWVLRSDLVIGGCSSILPEGFTERIKDRGLIVSWAPQVKVLNHPSVGGFLTHSGWNSTVESISMGVPMIGWPLFFDQFLDCRFSKEIWKVGIDFKDLDVGDNRLVRKEEVESAVKTLMRGAEGLDLRKRAMELKVAATKAVMQGGSSFTNIDIFVENMKKIAKTRLNQHY